MATHHIAEDGLELYALDRLAEPSAAPVEEYLLVCEECRKRLAGGGSVRSGEPFHVRRIVCASHPAAGPTSQHPIKQCSGPFYMLISCRNTALPNALFAYPGGAQHGLGRFSF
jgi:hypothetical protein